MTISITPARRGIRLGGALLACATLAAGAAPAASADDIAIIPPPNLTRTYLASDGGVLYTRAVGSTVVGLAEDPRSKRAFVFRGTRSGSTITGTCWDIAKGSTRRSNGALVLTQSAFGAALVRSGGDDPGPDAWSATADLITPSGPKEAGFQSTEVEDLAGAWDGNDSSRAYLRETGRNVVGVAEKWSDKAKPDYATVFIGTAGDPTYVTGSFYDIPKGTAERHGTFTAARLGSPRRLFPALTDAKTGSVTRATRYDADYALDYAKFAQWMNQSLLNNVVGYGWALIDDGAVHRQSAGGARYAKLITDLAGTESLPFYTSTQTDIASTSKTVTAVAVAKALEDRGISLEAPVAPYLPAAWTRGPGMDTVTFRQLLNHSAGLKRSNSCDTDFYLCLKDSVAAGLTEPPGYQNIHYTIMRVILPFVLDPNGMEAIFASYDPQTDGDTLNELFSAKFRDYTVALLKSAGASGDFAFGPDPAWGHSFGPPIANRRLSSTSYLEAGSGSLKISAPDYAKFLAAFEHGELVSPYMVGVMKGGGLGFDTNITAVPGDVGPLYTKTGATGGYGSQNIMFPGDTQAFVIVNSDGNNLYGSFRAILRDAWQNALI